MATKTTDSVAGAFQATYDEDGSVASEKLPGGYTLTTTEDTTGATLDRSYKRDSDGTLVYADTVTESIHGQVTSHAGWSDQTYRYDTTGRLTTVEDTADTICTNRTYTFDNRANRKTRTTTVGTPGLDCTTTGGTTTSHTYDSADRLVDAGYTYDAFDRTTALPGSTLGYYANDLAYQQTANSQRQTWQLDAALRFRSWKTETGSGTTWTQTGSKLNHYDSDGDNPRWITEDTATGTLTRNVESASGDLAATTSKTGDTTLQLTTIHGDIALQLPLDTSKAPVALDNDEYGNPRAGQAVTRYGWLGAKQRSAETLTGLTLMGVRLYNPATGRFLSPDPVYGGNLNAYEYAHADPLNRFDLDGRWSWAKKQWKRTKSWWGRTTRNPNVRHYYYAGRFIVSGFNPLRRYRTISRWVRNPGRMYRTCKRGWRGCAAMTWGGYSAVNYGRKYMRNYSYLRAYNQALTYASRDNVCRRYTGYRGASGTCT